MKWSDYINKTEFANRLDVGFERRVKCDSQAVGLNNWKGRAVI